MTVRSRCSGTPTTRCSMRWSQAFGARDGAAVFRAIDHVVEGGHDPRRFAMDLLDRLRDLIVLSAVPDAGSSGLLDAPEDQLERMRGQASELGGERLVRAAETVNAGLVEMRGATSPRLLLELMCAQVLLPQAGDRESDLRVRLERLEKRLESGGPAAIAATRPAAPAAAPAASARSRPRGTSQPRPREPGCRRSPRNPVRAGDKRAGDKRRQARRPRPSRPGPRAPRRRRPR